MAKESKRLTIKQLQDRAHRNAVNKGFYDPPRSFLESLTMIHTEISEAAEEYVSTDYPINMHRYDPKDNMKPIGIPSELAGAMIRIADTARFYKIDLTKAIREVMKHNDSRPRKHGKPRA